MPTESKADRVLLFKSERWASPFDPGKSKTLVAYENSHCVKEQIRELDAFPSVDQESQRKERIAIGPQ
jgi:hypothetical protein